MTALPERFVLFDTEYTSWEGAKQRNWSGPNEYREVIQIGAVKVGSGLTSEGEFMMYVKPVKNPVLSDFIKELTHISQESIDTEGVSLEEALAAFNTWSEGLPLWSHGNDLAVIEANCALIGVPYPFFGRVWGGTRELFRNHVVDMEKYSSGTILKAFGKEPPLQAHDAVNDMRNLLLALRELAEKR